MRLHEKQIGESSVTLTEPFVSESKCVVVVIPAYKEERFIGSVVVKAHKYADTVIVVDDGSGDATAEIARATGCRHELSGSSGHGFCL
jgi:cellulose synthase/poly-beta-1,6-N-acetylglucosamine synthase-like glycosyltransferase